MKLATRIRNWWMQRRYRRIDARQRRQADERIAKMVGVSLDVLDQPLVARSRPTTVLGEACHLYGPCPACEELNAAKQRSRSDPAWLDPYACPTHLKYQFHHRHDSPPPRTVHDEPVLVGP